MLGTNPWFKKPRVIGEKVGKLQGKCRGFAWEKILKVIFNGKSSDSLFLKILIKRVKNRHVDRRVAIEYALGNSGHNLTRTNNYYFTRILFIRKAPTLKQAAGSQ